MTSSIQLEPLPLLFFGFSITGPAVAVCTHPYCCAGYLPELKRHYRPHLEEENSAFSPLLMVLGLELLEEQEAACSSTSLHAISLLLWATREADH